MAKELDVPTQDEIADRLESMPTQMSPAEVAALEGTRKGAANKRKQTKDALEREPKVSLFIPDGVDEYAAINGVGYPLKAGKTHEVPASIARLVQNKWAAHARSQKSRNIDLGTL